MLPLNNYLRIYYFTNYEKATQKTIRNLLSQVKQNIWSSSLHCISTVLRDPKDLFFFLL